MFLGSKLKRNQGISTENEVYGDLATLYLNFVLNDYDIGSLMITVKLEVTDPEGKLVFKKTLVDHVIDFTLFLLRQLQKV